RQHPGDLEPPSGRLGKTARRQRRRHRDARSPPASRPYPKMRAAELENQAAVRTKWRKSHDLNHGRLRENTPTGLSNDLFSTFRQGKEFLTKNVRNETCRKD